MSDSHRKPAAFRALVWKEWRQLLLLRIVGAGLSLLVPPLLLVASAAGRRGILPFGSTASFTARDVLVDLVPPVMVAMWGVLTLFVMAQTFVGDRAAGVELFLLASPVRRRWVWGARIAAAAGSMLVIAATGIVTWAAWSAGATGTAAVTGSAGLWILLVGGAVTILIAVAGGLVAGALVPAPLPAVLAGLVLGVLPLGLAALLGGFFPFAAFLTVRVGMVLPLLLFPAFGLASYRALCTGEPAGRGRVRRAGWVLAGALGTIAVAFLVLAPLAVRASGETHRDGRLTPSPTRAMALVNGGWPVSRGWLVDTSDGAARHAFGLAIEGGAWSVDGHHLAVIAEGGPFGLRLPSPRLEIYDTTRMQLAQTLSASDAGLSAVPVIGARWTATHLVLAGWDESGRSRLGAIRLADWRARPLAVDASFLDAHPWSLAGPGADGTLFLVALGGPRNSVLRLHALDVENGAISPPRLEHDVPGSPDRSGLMILDADWRLSPTGRLWITSGQAADGNLRVQDIAGGSPTEIEATHIGRVTWLAGDTLVFSDEEEQRSRLRAWSPATGVRDLRTAGPEFRFDLQPSPDRARLLVQESAPSAKNSIRYAARVYNTATGNWFDVEHQPVPARVSAWAGPDVLAFWTQEGLIYRPVE